MPENNSDNSQTSELEELELKAARLRLRLLTMALTLGRGCLIFFLVLCGLALLYFTLDVLEHVHIVAGMTAIATLAAYVLAPSVNYLNRKKGLNRILSITIIYLVLGLVIGTCGAFLVPVLKQQFVSLTETITNFSQSTPEQLLAMAKKMRDSAPESFRPSIDAFIAEHQQDGNLIPKLQSELRDKLPNLLGGTFSGVFSGVKTAVSGLLATVLIPLFTFYILMDSERYYNSVVRLVPRRFKSDAQELLHDIDQVLGSYIRGQLMVCATIGFSIGVALNLIGLEYATLIGLFAGVVDIIPYVGVAIGMIPAALVAWINHGFLWMLFVILVMEVVHWTEGHIIVPAIIGHSVGLPPLVVMIALGAGAELGGVMGMVFAIPIAAILRVLALFYVKRLESADLDSPEQLGATNDPQVP